MNESLSTRESAPKFRVLVVDDISKNLQLVGTMLRSEGYHVMPATSGAQALERAMAQTPDLILLDLMMPEMDGLETCRRLKALRPTEQVPVIFLTASNEMDFLVKGFGVGAVDYITKPFNAPELLARVRNHLELQHARARLREMNDEKNEFMGMVTHDLMNPLGAIQGYAEMILEDTAGQPGDVANAAARIHETARRMTEMVQQLLDVNRIERGELRLQVASTDLIPLLSIAVATLRPRATAKSQALHTQVSPGPINAVVDSNVTVQVFENLVSNAVKYSPPGKNIVARLKREGRRVRFEVQDEGPGLSEDDQKKLFGKFARLSARPTGGENSTGLGLSIVKRMVEAMDGAVWCESEPGRGALFVVQFTSSE